MHQQSVGAQWYRNTRLLCDMLYLSRSALISFVEQETKGGGGESATSVPLLTSAAHCIVRHSLPALTGFASSHSQTVKFAGLPTNYDVGHCNTRPRGSGSQRGAAVPGILDVVLLVCCAPCAADQAVPDDSVPGPRVVRTWIPRVAGGGGGLGGRGKNSLMPLLTHVSIAPLWAGCPVLIP